MAEEIVRILKVDTKNSGKSIKELRNEIKALKNELEKATVGSEEFESTLKQLTQTQKTYNSVQQQIRDMSRTNQQDMVKLAGFAKNLAKSYSAVNAAIGLFADGNEDIQRTMLKVQRTIQLIQGLSGIQGLVRDIPKVVNAFKGWISALNPIERKVDSIVKGINGISSAKLKAINEANRAAAGAGANASASVTGVGNVQQINAQTQAIQEQTQVITALNSARDGEIKKLTELQAQQNKTIAETVKLTNKADVTVDTMGRLAVQIEAVETEMNLLIAKSPSLEAAKANPRIQELSVKLAELNKQMIALKTTANETIATAKQAPAALDSTQAEIDQTKQKINELDGALVSAGKAAKTAGSFFKTLGKTVGWTAVIALAVGLVMKLLDALGLTVDKIWDFITGANSAANATKKLNKEISETANQTSAKAIVALRNLSAAYAKLGNDAKAKEKFLVDYADKIRETGLAVDTVKEAEDVFIKNTGKYVDAIKKRAKAQAIEAAVVKLYQEYLDRRYDLEQKLQKATDKGRERRRSKLIKEIEEEDRKINDMMNKSLGEAAKLDREYSAIFASLESSTKPSVSSSNKTDWAKEYKEALAALKKYNQERLDLLKDGRTRELDENKRAYEEDLKNIQETYDAGVKAAQGNKTKLLELEKEKNEALKLAKVTYERQRLEIIDKYNDEAFQKEKAALDKEYDELEHQLERRLKLNESMRDELRNPADMESKYQTRYKQPVISTILGLGKDWTNTYQTKKQMEDQYNDQVKYNNDVLRLTKDRLNGENKVLDEEINTLNKKKNLLKEKLDTTDLFDVEKRKEIEGEIKSIDERITDNQLKLSANRIAASNAELQTEKANTEAYDELQEKKRQKMLAYADAISNVSGAIASMAKLEAQNAEEGSRKQKRALAAYKTFAITQTIIDTWKGAQEAYVAMAGIPTVGPALGIAAAAIAVAAGMANVMAIKNESLSGGAKSASVSAPAPVDTAPISYSRNLIGDKELDDLNQPIKCYVLESDITNKQNKVKVTESNATF